MILVTSASGQTGTRLVRALRARGASVRGMVKRAGSAALVESLGAEVVVGDPWNEDDLRRAMRGISRVYHIAPSLTHDEHALGRRVIDAAIDSNIAHFVLHGVMAPYLDNINYHWAKQLLQRDLYRSGLPYTVLLPTNYMQNVSWTWPLVAREGRWVLPYDVDKRLTWVDLDDVAAAAAIVLTEDGHAYGTYELCGTDAFLSRREIAALMSDVLERPVVAEAQSPDDYLALSRSQPFFARFRDEELTQIRAMFDDYGRYGMPAGNARVLSMLLGRPATSYREFLARLARSIDQPDAGAVTSYGLPGGH